MTSDQVRIVELDPEGFRARIDELLSIYVTAMRYPESTGAARAPLWAEHSRRPEFRCVVAVDATGTALSVGYGYLGRLGQWWYTEVARGLAPSSRWWLDDYFELTELHVRPDAQGRGLGELTVRGLLARAAGAKVLLSTPEGENRAWRLYRRLGFVDVLRDHLFTGDPRPFGVLGRPLPLSPPTAAAPPGAGV